jgi:hypothetical protein
VPSLGEGRARGSNVSTVPAASRQARLQAVRGLGRHEVVVDRIWPRALTKQDANIDVWPKDVAPRSDLANARMVGREDFVAAPLLTLVMAPAGVPADERLLVPPVRM